MLYFVYDNDKLVQVTAKCVDNGQSRWDFKTIEMAEKVAQDATTLMGDLYIATDAGEFSGPRYDVIRAPKVGDKVSRAFNGDSYPAGEIVKVSTSLRRVQTSTGVVFWRDKQSARWVSNGTWSMTGGHEERRNPEF